MSNRKDVVLRHAYPARVAHWLTVLGFFMVAISGMAFFFPSLRWMLGIMGTPQLAQFLHPVFGIVMMLGLIVLFFRNASYCLPEPGDAKWFSGMAAILKGREHELSGVEVGHYNPGQKMLFWVIMSLSCVLLITGLIAWQPYFADAFSIPVRRVALFLHSLCAVVLIFSIIVHIYMGFWYKGTVRGMLYGTVTRSWAKKHHPRWLRSLAKDGKSH